MGDQPKLRCTNPFHGFRCALVMETTYQTLTKAVPENARISRKEIFSKPEFGYMCWISFGVNWVISAAVVEQRKINKN